MSTRRSLKSDHRPVKVTDSGLGETYHPGDVARGYLVVENVGDRPVRAITVTITIYPDRLFGLP
ncbi:MAG TPA: hypothetical protein VLT35_02560, partial [Methanocella sp.]|nr:hypothetical protein [Methanocella sp.]